MRIFHIATAADWEAAQAAGTYSTSTRGRTLAEEGFIHASRGDQWQGVRERYYADVTEPLLLLSIDTDLLSSPVVDEPVPGTGETFPHIYGPIQVEAVVTILPLDGQLGRAALRAAGAVAAGATSPADGTHAVAATGPESESFSRLFLQELFKQLVLASLVLGVIVAATLVGQATGLEWGPVTGAAVGLLLGVLAARTLARRRAD